jgi:tetratricopeptide (TPR) repeat protein
VWPAELGSDHPSPSLSLLPADPVPADDEYVAAVRNLIPRLVALDVESGGEQTSILAMQYLSRVYCRLGSRLYYPRVKKDLQAAAAELAELTGWLLCDANEHTVATRINQEAIQLARMVGYQSMELFVTHNMSLEATYLRQPTTALSLIRPALGRNGLTPRIAAMFQLREARSYAQMGLRHDALKTLKRAKGLLLDGVSDHDPKWAWWVSERGFTHATGLMLGSLGDWATAIEPVHRALEMAPPQDRRDRFLYLCALTHAQTKVGAWNDAQASAEQLISLVDTVHSPRPLATLAATIGRHGRPRRLPSTLDDTVEEICRRAADQGLVCNGRTHTSSRARRPRTH